MRYDIITLKIMYISGVAGIMIWSGQIICFNIQKA